MKKFCKVKYLLLVAVMLLMSFGSVLSGCFEVGGWRPDKPEIKINAESYSISWDKVDNAYQYEIYCNNKIKKTYVSSNAIGDTFIFTFDHLLTDTGNYKFYVLAIHSDGRESETSNVVTYTCNAIPTTTSQILGEFDSTPISQSTITASIYSTNLYINLGTTTADSYELYMYSQSTGLNIYPLNLTIMTGESYVVNLSNYMNTYYDDIYAIRIGAVRGTEKEICSGIYYYNPYSFSPYTDASHIYIFDGKINDAYVNSIQELRNLIYYNFIYRIPNQPIRISASFESLLKDVYSESGKLAITDSLANAVTDCFNYFFETRDAYSITVKYVASMQFEIQINYDQARFQNNEAKSEPAQNLYPSYYMYTEIDWDTYYETCGYTMRKDDPKYATVEPEFYSDKQFLYVPVESSEELYWAVENHYTPMCVKDSTAETLYQDIKDVLNSIISDDMTDYEKALSIFDWINANTSYDYYSVSSMGYTGVAANLIPAYYLEGVFVTKYAVCDGFSKAFSIMCNMEGIECMRVAGEVLLNYNEQTNEETYGGHAWNKVKLDINENDEIGAQYYLVDITWTEMVGSIYYSEASLSGKEVTSHEYFLVDDSYADTHYEYENRPKYKELDTGVRYDYYDNTMFSFDAAAYGLLNTISSNEYNLVIDSTPDLQSMFYYMLVNGRETLEVVIDYNYMVNIHRTKGGTANDDYEDIVKSLLAELKENKFAEQYITVNSNQYELIEYNSYKDKGIIIVFEQHLLIDDANEQGHMVQFFDHYEVYQKYELYIIHDILVTYPGDTVEKRVENLFATALADSNLAINVEYVDTVTKKDPDTNKKEVQYVFNITFVPAN